MVRYLFLFGVAAVPVLADPPVESPTPLAEAVAIFNQRASEDSVGKDQPPLTPDAVIAAIRWEMLHREKLLVSDDTFRILGEIVDHASLPKGFELEKVRGYEPNDRFTFDVWSVRLRIPGGTLPGGTTCIKIQEKMIHSRVIGDEERQIIRKWQQLESARGGIGSFERVEWMRRYYREREEAAARDREKNR